MPESLMPDPLGEKLISKKFKEELNEEKFHIEKKFEVGRLSH